ncbi:serine protease [Sorangium sp. So ce321]|uniref:trypsin-like serine peptidase n=1 Tax=Sorangium sp. So ce321 TaxID=3133300 RepID=UPI003F62E22D
MSELEDLTEQLAMWRRAAERALQGKRVQEAINAPRALVPPGAGIDDASAQLAVDLLQAGELPNPAQLASLAQCLRLLRTPLFVTQGAIVDPAPMLPDAEPRWRPGQWGAFMRRSAAWLRAVCRVDRADGTPEGTAFLVGPELVMTAGHVVMDASLGVGRLMRGQATVRFGQERNTLDPEPPIDVVSVMFLDTQLDVALLKIDRTPDGVAPLVLSSRSSALHAEVAAVGYPRKDASRNLGIGLAIFGEPFDVKRVAPGEIIKLFPGEFRHDCCTLGGNSGSPMLDVSTGSVLGVHVRGMNGWYNVAVSADSLARRPDLRDKIEHWTD